MGCSTMSTLAQEQRRRQLQYAWRKYRIDRRMHWLNKYKLAKGCDVCGYGRIQHGCQAVLAKGLDWAHVDPLSKSSYLFENKETMYSLARRVSKDPVKNRQYRRELFDELKKCRLLCKLDHIAESHERNESKDNHILGDERRVIKAGRNDTPHEESKYLMVDTIKRICFYDREEQAVGREGLHSMGSHATLCQLWPT